MSSDKATRGNSSKHWNKDLVFKACEELAKKEITPTVSSVRNHLKIEKGSDSTVQRFIRLYREEGSQVEKPDAPEPLMTALASLWDQALTAARNEVEESRSALDKEKKAFKLEQVSLEESLLNSEERVRELEEQTASLKIDNQELAEVLQQQSGAIAELSKEKHEAVDTLAKKEIHLEHAQGQLSIVQDALKQKDTIIESMQDIYKQNLQLRDNALKRKLQEHLSEKIIDEIFKDQA